MNYLAWFNLVAGAVRPKNQREGQYWFNCLHRDYPALAELVRGTEADPFYVDERLDLFFAFVENQWDSVSGLED